MNKKIIAVAVLLLAFVVALTACKKKEKYTYTDIGGVEVTVKENGDMFVTNVDGDEIPVTTSEDGFYDMDIEHLFTETTTKKTPWWKKPSDKNNDKDNSTKPTEGVTNPSDPAKQPTVPDTSKPTGGSDNKPTDPTKPPKPSETRAPIQITPDKKGDAVSWDDIVNA